MDNNLLRYQCSGPSIHPVVKPIHSRTCIESSRHRCVVLFAYQFLDKHLNSSLHLHHGTEKFDSPFTAHHASNDPFLKVSSNTMSSPLTLKTKSPAQHEIWSSDFDFNVWTNSFISVPMSVTWMKFCGIFWLQWSLQWFNRAILVSSWLFYNINY